MRYRVQYTETKPGGTRVRQDTVRDGSLDDVWTYLNQYEEVGDVTITEFGQSDSPGRVVYPEWKRR